MSFYSSGGLDQHHNNEESQYNLMIGQLAFLKGYMSEENVHQILDIQKTNQRPFGELCIANGMMTSDQMFELLQLQLKNQCFLFNSLLPVAANKNKMGAQIDQFKHDVLCNDQAVVETKLYDVHFLNSIFRQTRTFLFHQGYFTQTQSVTSDLVSSANQVNFACEIISEHDSSYYICLCLNEKIVSSIAASKQQSFSHNIDPCQFQDLFIEIMYCLNYQITQNLRKLGHQVKQGVALAHIPAHRQCVSINFNTIIDPISIAVVT